MRIVLRHTGTGRLYGIAGDWVYSPLDALTFDSPFAAGRFARTSRLNAVEAVVLLPDGQLGGSLQLSA